MDAATTKDINALKVDIADLRTELRTEMASLSTEVVGVHIKIANVKAKIRGAAITQLRWALGFLVVWSVVMLCVIRLVF